ncbi:MAG: 2-phosphosulfolactate phosphatase [Proteobacteria bacterium]|nr:2-phosphosulfolactate phosphatase [Pseudomonadota bacterium]
MAKIHVLLKKEELDNERLSGKVVVVLDILFATSSIVAALAHGAGEVIPTRDGAAAQAEAARHAAGSYLLSGEINAETLPGFVHPTPLALLQQELAGRSLIYSTTNGTVALKKSAGAEHIYAAALLNGDAVVRHISRTHADNTVLVVCSGSVDNFNLEDFYGAGYMISLFRQTDATHEFSDAALAAEMLHANTDAVTCLMQSRVGRLMLARRLDEEIRFAARKSVFDCVPQLTPGGSLRLI